MEVINLLDQLDDLIYHSKPVGFRGQVRVDREDAYALLDQIRVALPEEIKQADWIVKERQELQREEPDNGGLRAVVGSIDELKRSRRSAPPPLTPAAAEKVCSIIEEAEQVRAQAEAQLTRANEVTRTLLQEAGAASAEIDDLVDRVRDPAAALAEVLRDRAAALEAEFGRMRAAIDQANVGTGSSSAAEPSTPAAVEPAQPDHEADPDVVFQPTEEWDPVEVMAGEEDELDPVLPGPESHVHAERLEDAGEPAPEEPDPAAPEIDLLEPRPPRFGRWRRAEDAS